MTGFQISTNNSGRYRTVQVRVYDTLEDMRRAGVRHSKRHTPDITEGFDKTFGLAQSYWKEQLNGKRWSKLPDAGYIRLWEGALRTGIITHECTHIAVAIYQQDIAKTFNIHDNEERFCYLVGDLSAKLINKLYANNLIPEPGK